MKQQFRCMKELSAVAAVAFSVASCSGRQVSYKFSESDLAIINQKNGRAAAASSNVTVQVSQGFGLLSEPASVTRLSSLLTAVKTSMGSTYRFALVNSDTSDCSNWSNFQPAQEPLKVGLGSDGEKTLCLQEKNKSGQLSDVKYYKFTKDSGSANGPAYSLVGKPERFTSLSEARMTIDSADAFEYRAQFVNSSECGTLEDSTWVALAKPIETQFRFDGAWSLCLQVRDINGVMTPEVQKFTWTRDTVYPVLENLDLPSGAVQKDEFSVTIKGSQVYEYQHALVDGLSDCKNANYSDFVSVSEPLNIKITENGIKTLCILSRSEGGLLQQAPYVHLLQKLNLQAQVRAIPVPSGTNTATPKQFTISGEAVTHYKVLSFDFSTTCDGKSAPSGAAKPASDALSLAFSGGGVKTLCVWGVSQADGGSTLVQSSPTFFRFYNDMSDYTFVYESNLSPYSLQEAAKTCGFCHNSFISAAGFQSASVSISQRLRQPGYSRPMPPSGWSSDEKRKRMMLFLYSLPGYPQDLPQVK